MRDTCTMQCPNCEIELPILDWIAVSQMWNCGFTMSEAVANYERLLVHYTQQIRVGQSSAQIPFAS
jgi:hypothetical protein